MSSLDILRKDALDTRLKGIAGGNRIFWSAKDVSLIRDYVLSQPESFFRKAAAPARQSSDLNIARRDAGTTTRDIQAGDRNFLWVISKTQVDLANDVVHVEGIDTASFNKNPTVLPFHDSSQLPIAVSSAPVVSGQSLMAVARFPKPGVSAASDQVAAAIRAGLVKGASIGFIPLRWSFSKDPSRPLGVDFHSVKLLEWSVCSQPCCQGCLVVGPVSEKSMSDHMAAARQAEARALTSQARSTGEKRLPAPLSREQRLAEAREFRRRANATR